MKILSFVVPCYNSQDHMRHCLDSLLPQGDDVEILIVNDGSTDGTAAIADSYQQRYPGTVRVHHQENGGHGGAVTAGVKLATGLYVKVVDSDDWVDVAAYRALLQTIRGFAAGNRPDMIVSNYVYEKQGKKNKRVVRYRHSIPAGRVVGWDEVKRFHTGHYLLMHAITYRTQLLQEHGMELPRHTFYVDNLYAFVPLQWVKTLYYADVDLYRYFIGREGQSVQEDVMIRRIDQQLRVNRQMVTSVDFNALGSPSLRRYLLHYLEIVTVVSSVLLLRSGTQENADKKKELWAFIKKQDYDVYRQLRRSLMGAVVNLPGALGKALSLAAYTISQKIVGFN